MFFAKLKNDPRIDRLFITLTLATTIVLFLTVVLGGIVRVAEAGNACSDWPTCLGQWTPPIEPNALVNYLHRATTALIFLLLLRSLWVGYIGQATPVVRKLLMVSMVLLGLQVLWGWAIASGDYSAFHDWINVIHLLFSLAMLGSMSAVLVLSFYRQYASGNRGRLTFQSKFGRTSIVLLISLFVLLISGAMVTNIPERLNCASWPLCTEQFFPSDWASWINMTHRTLVLLTGILMVATWIQAWRTQRSQTPILVSTTVGVVLFFAQALMGAKMVDGFPTYLLVLHQATAVAVWIAFVVQAVVTGLAVRSTGDELDEAAQIQGGKGLWKDLLMLTKPRVVVLLLVTTLAGMVIGAREWPRLDIMLWTLLGGFMAAGGSGAINQYIDREDDGKMQRTQKRPIPSGRLTPGEGLAFGAAMVLSSFYLMTAFVNFLSALLVLTGIIYYVLIYSIFLKKTTVQNIVIGGGAGAIPPLVGWAAATGSLNIPALFLFAIVFMWTPPHFWALALVRRKDYARAGVPMLPVVRGEKETRWQIFLFTVELVGLTLLLPLFGLGGSIYLFSAVLFGLWLLMAAWKVWKLGGNKLAWKMYRYSSMYLAFLFIALMVDRLVS